MRFNAQAFDRHLNNIGQKVQWRRSYACACVNPASGAADPKHALCGGKGRLWNDPITTVAGVSRQETNMEWVKAGLWEDGDMTLSIPQNSPMWDAGQFDRFTMLNATDTFSQPMTRGAPTEKFLFTPLKIERVFWLHPQTRVAVDGDVPTVGPDGLPRWAAGAVEPPPGVTYSITGTRHDEYFVYKSLPSDRNQHQGMRLPRRVMCRRWDLFGR